jgi:hypothetical protein
VREHRVDDLRVPLRGDVAVAARLAEAEEERADSVPSGRLTPTRRASLATPARLPAAAGAAGAVEGADPRGLAVGPHDGRRTARGDDVDAGCLDVRGLDVGVMTSGGEEGEQAQ